MTRPYLLVRSFPISPVKGKDKMAVAINPIRKFKFVSNIDPEVVIHCSFNSEEDWQYKSTDTGLNVLHRNIRQSFTKWEGFNVPEYDTDEVEIVDENGEVVLPGSLLPVTEESQKGVLTWVLQEDKELFSKILDAYKGVSIKKSKGGVKPQGNGTGDLPSAKAVNS
jgi:hypothetical protein